MFQGVISSVINIIKNHVFLTKRMYNIGRIKYMRTCVGPEVLGVRHRCTNVSAACFLKEHDQLRQGKASLFV